ncbi:MAG TPA: transglycosylase SLT domain-containing protein [Rhodospirillaceae bacterium]|nr:transglycosylase SLT domain-containing protein [Rhodospirillaceae bacterium]
MRQSLILAALLLPLLGPTAAPAAQTGGPTAPQIVGGHEQATSCLSEIAKAEKRYALPPGLLVAISLVESGRRDPITGIIAPWPFTLNAKGTGKYFETLDEAVREAGKYLAQGYGYVDVGCMQVDLYHHPQAFRTLAAAFDPETNIDYAAAYLRRLFGTYHSWTSAVAAYNAGDPRNGTEYLARVLYYWRDLKTTVEKSYTPPENPRRRGFIIEDAPSPFEVATTFYTNKDYGSALAIYRRALDTRPDDPAALLGAAECLAQTGKPDEARTMLEHALIGDPASQPALTALLRVIEGAPAERRLTQLLSARRVAPSRPELLSRIALAEAEAGRQAEAVADMGLAVSLSPNDPVLLLNHALLLDRAKQTSQAIKAYEIFLKVFRPGSAVLTVSLQQIRERYAFLQRAEH